VTEEELDTLAFAIERVLPKDAREEAARRRREARQERARQHERYVEPRCSRTVRHVRTPGPRNVRALVSSTPPSSLCGGRFDPKHVERRAASLWRET
jgi:hypothetical protein